MQISLVGSHSVEVFRDPTMMKSGQVVVEKETPEQVGQLR